jgi:excisionase family DNA binding protein
MLSTPPIVDTAFRQLLTALDAEIAELRQIGSRHFHHDGAPRESQGLLRRANQRTHIRAEIESLQREWQENAAPTLAPLPTEESDIEPANPVLIRHIKGISARDAAKRLGVGEAKVREWLEAGTLKGYRPTGGHWKITPADLLAFARAHRN